MSEKQSQSVCLDSVTGKMNGVNISVTYKGISRRVEGNDCWFGGEKS